VRLLAIETSTQRGSVALLEDDRVVCLAEHDQPSAHAERILSLIEDCLRQSGWQRSALERIAVGVGPGSFVGLRVGIALAQGLGLGLRVPVVGVGSLRSLSEAVPSARTERRLALLDARRDELFAAVYAADGSELVAPSLWPRSEARARVEALGPDLVIVGDVASTLDLGAGSVFTGERCFPSAERCARIARGLDPEAWPATPHYCRGPGADLPNLPPSPLGEAGPD
jgi:tRNA threonylcarbamoyladenosine biosynthesis protein TsaB